MSKTGNGYRRHTLKNQPPAGASRWRGERRKDKPTAGPKWFRSYRRHYLGA